MWEPEGHGCRLIHTHHHTHTAHDSVLLPLDSAGLLTTAMQHALRALRSPEGKAVLLAIMEVYLRVRSLWIVDCGSGTVLVLVLVFVWASLPADQSQTI